MEYVSSYQPYSLHNRYTQQQPVTNTIIRQAHQQQLSISSQQYQQEIPPPLLHTNTYPVRYATAPRPPHGDLPQVKVSAYPHPPFNQTDQTGAQVIYPSSYSNHLHPPPAPPPSANTSPQTYHLQHPNHPYNNPPQSTNQWSIKPPLNPQSAAVRQQYQQQHHVLPPTSPIVAAVPYPYSSAVAGVGACGGSSDCSSPTAYPNPTSLVPATLLTAQQQRDQNQQRRHIQQQNSQLNEQFIFPHLIHQRQRGLQPIQRRWYLWAIGILDIIAVVWTTSLVIRDSFLKPIADPNEFIWYFFWTSLVILARFTMGMCLIIGLHSSDDPSTLWYCRMWMWCQYFVFLMLIPEFFTSFGSLLNTPTNTLWQKSIPLKFLVELAAVLYRVLCYLLVKKFINRLEKCESVFLDRVHQRQLQEDRDRRRSQDQGDGETSFCGPSIALIMSL